MADNTQLSLRSGDGDTVRTEDIAGVKFPVTKIVLGAANVNDLPVSSANPLPTHFVNRTASGALGAAGNAVTISAQGAGTVHWEIDTGTLAGTVIAEATLDDTTWFTVNVIENDGTISSSFTAFGKRGLFVTGGYSQVRLRVSAYTSGSSSARLEAADATAVVRLGQAIPPGANNIGDVDLIAGQTGITGGAGAVADNSPRMTLASNDPAVTALQIIDDWDETDRAKINPIVGQAGVAAGAGAVGATTQRTTLASDDPAVVALQIMDDWDETDRAKVNLIAAQAGITGGAGAVAANTPRVTHASDDPAVTALQLIDNASVAHDAAVVAGVTQLGLDARSAEPTVVTTGNATRALATLLGKQVTVPYAIPASTWSYASVAGGIIDTADDVAKAAGAAGVRNYVTRCQVINGHATVSTEVVIKDGATIIWRGWAQAAGGGVTAVFDPPLRGTAATAVNVTNITTGSATYFNLQGFTASE